jgi:hypothetical protein
MPKYAMTSSRMVEKAPPINQSIERRHECDGVDVLEFGEVSRPEASNELSGCHFTYPDLYSRREEKTTRQVAFEMSENDPLAKRRRVMPRFLKGWGPSHDQR